MEVNLHIVLMEMCIPYTSLVVFAFMGDARTQSPTIKNYAPESPTFGEIAGFSQAGCNALAST